MTWQVPDFLGLKGIWDFFKAILPHRSVPNSLRLGQFNALRDKPFLKRLDIDFPRQRFIPDSQSGSCPGGLTHLDAVRDDVEHRISGFIG